MMLVVLLEIQTASLSYAAHGSAAFTVIPTFIKPYNVHPRAYFIYDMAPGTQISDHIHIANTGSAQGSLRLYISDAVTAPGGGASFLPENAPRRDVSSWLSLSYQQVTLNPGQSIELPFTLTIPRHVRPGQHGGVIVAEEINNQQYMEHLSRSRSIAIGVQASFALGVLINLPGPTLEQLNVGGITYNEKSRYQTLNVALKNTGTQLLHPSGYLRVFDERGKRLQDLKLQLGTFVPQTSINYPAVIQRKPLLPGKRYIAQLHLTYEHGHTLNYRTTFFVPVPEKPLNKVIQNLDMPVITPSEDLWSQLTPWHYFVIVCFLFALLSSLLFWAPKISKILTQRKNKKRE
jgi:hypothetical protein